ncbi:MAG: glycoside hydrolase [Clostridium butyricum]|nr:glycoside hydrolase [Clostridium butyricum]
MNNKTFSPERKDRKKKIRSIIQGLILIVLMIIMLKALFSFTKYKPYDVSKISDNNDDEFIAVSYFGVDRNGTETLISTDRLNEHLKALTDNGYVTITQQDVIDFYTKGKKLPPKALFLIFEDGRTDTAIFSQKITEEYNLKSTILTYSDRFEKGDPKFLQPDDLKKLEESTFWELGTNGYRLEYINVFNKDKEFLGRMTSLEFSKKSDEIRRDYNHYLMDFIRDEDNVPVESYEEMKNRIDYDYETSSRIYNEKLGKDPDLYILMHSNTGQFGTNKKASKINEKWIKELYKMNFNREGYSLNTLDSSIYDLTRIQPQAYWPTNHLLMRIYDDTKKKMNFVTGDEKKAAEFKEIKGKAEFKDDTVTITSEPRSKGLFKILNTDDFKDIDFSVNLQGNILGSQSIYLRSNDDQSSSISVELSNNIVSIKDKNNNHEIELFKKELNTDKHEFDIKDLGNRHMHIKLNDNKLSLDIDNVNVADDIEVSDNSKGAVYLGSAWNEYGYSQKNIADDVYDGVFKEIDIKDMNGNILYSNVLRGKDKVVYSMKNYFNKVVNWFIINL